MSYKRYAVCITGEILIWQNAGETDQIGDERAREVAADIHFRKCGELDVWIPESGRHFVATMTDPNAKQLTTWGFLDEWNSEEA